MDPYFLAIVALIIFSILVILYVRIFAKDIHSDNPADTKKDSGSSEKEGESEANVLSHIKPDDFTLLD